MAGTISRGIKAPIVREGDDIVKVVVDSVLAAAEQDGFKLQEKDVIAVTEAVVARAAGNYAKTEDIAADVKAKLGGETVGVVFPILSR
ncbi:MAG: coenzyme F420-0:L-glutamate ligase, partial [Anaerotignum sp.]|nr:coenzyme F420-0:L-glutamate ligase [Anaerotignum sp.]